MWSLQLGKPIKKAEKYKIGCDSALNNQFGCNNIYRPKKHVKTHKIDALIEENKTGIGELNCLLCIQDVDKHLNTKCY